MPATVGLDRGVLLMGGDPNRKEIAEKALRIFYILTLLHTTCELLSFGIFLFLVSLCVAFYDHRN